MSAQLQQEVAVPRPASGSRPPMISLVVPTYKERLNISELVERTGKALAACSDNYELIIVDDDSPDGTGEEVRRLQGDRPWLKLVVRKYERDLSTAVTAGWRVARGEILGCMDGDLQHPPELLPAMLGRMRKTGAEIMVGSRHVAGGGVSQWSLGRRVISWTATLMAAFILPGTLGKVRDPMSGFFLVRRSVLESAALNPVGYKILLEVLAKGDYRRVEETPFIFEERFNGGSKLGPNTVLKYLLHLLRLSVDTGEAWRLAKYALVGLSGALVNFVSLRWLVTTWNWQVATAALGGAGLAILNNFIWNETFTFPETRRAEPGLSQVFRRLGLFAALSTSGLGINVGLVWLIARGLRFPLAPSVVAGIGVAAAWNFITNSNVTWRPWWKRTVLSKAGGRPTLSKPASAAAAGSRAGQLVDVPCNLCHSTRVNVLYQGNPGSAAKTPAHVFRCTSEGHRDFIRVVQCSGCGLVFESPRESEPLIQEQYARVEDPTYEREEEGRVRTFSKLLDGLERYAELGKMLEVGCYTGVFLNLARQRGWQTLGVEPSRWAAQKAREKGLAVINAPLGQARIPEQSFDVVAMWDVIEHLPDPRGTLEELFRVLRPGGILCLSTMDAGCVFAKLAGRHWPWLMRMHLYYFNVGTMTRMLSAAGFEALAIERHKRIVSLRYLFEKIGASLASPLGRVGRWLGVPFSNSYVSVDLGDIMNVFAVRTPVPAMDALTSETLSPTQERFSGCFPM